MSKSRTYYAVKNATITVICQAAHLVTGVISRTLLTKLLGAEYLGVNGLFTNILTVLSFAELGIGDALIYHMYRPLAEGDERKLAAYAGLYRRAYRVVIRVIAVCGIAMVPFLHYIVEAPHVRESLTLLYLLYLLDTLITYTCAYKKSVLIADQRSYIVSIFTQVFRIAMNIAQCIVLVLTHSFIAYFAVKIVCNLASNAACSLYAQKRYPCIAQKNVPKLDKQETDSLKTDVKGLLLAKTAATAFNGTDNIFISKFIGIVYVGILSNYTMLLDIVNSIMNMVFGSITASIGNLNVTGDMRQTEKVLDRIFFFNTSLYGYLTVGMILLLQEFITKIWLGAEYDLPFGIVLVSIANLFLNEIHHPLNTVRSALGLLSEYRWTAVLFAALNILLDFLLVKPLGMVGLFLATIFCRFGLICVDIYVVYNMTFKKSPLGYLLKTLYWLVFVGAECVICHALLQCVPVGGVTGFALKIAVISIAYCISHRIVFGKTDDYLYYKGMAAKLIKMKRHRSK